MAIRTYVKVSAIVDEYGKTTPLYLTFKGKKYEIDKVFDIRQAAAINAGGHGIRYSIRIGLHKTYLFRKRKAEHHLLNRTQDGYNVSKMS